MPVVITLRVTPLQNVRLRPHRSPAQGFFLALIKAALDPKTSKNLHDGVPVPSTGLRRTAYTVAPLHFAPRDDSPLVPLAMVGDYLPAGKTITLRVGLASDDTAKQWLQELAGRTVGLPPLSGAPGQLERIPDAASIDEGVSAFGGDPDVLAFSWSLLAKAAPARRLRFDFLTPTAFKSHGHFLPACEPERLWGSWATAWEAFAPDWLRAELHSNRLLPRSPAHEITPEAAALPYLAAYDLHTETVDLEGDTVTGFVGWAEFAFRANTPHVDRHRACALATVADFLGTGAKTAMGLGQTRCTLLDAG